jgi:membrane protein DedA with SNARE-associated domain
MEKEVRGSVLATILLCVLVLGKVGDAIGLAYIDSNPILVLVLNANDLHCALSTSRVNVWIWFVVSAIRRLCEDPIYYWLGRKYRSKALTFLKSWFPSSEKAFNESEGLFRTGSFVTIALNPGIVVCTLAGVSRVPPLSYLTMNFIGVLLRLTLIHVLCSLFPDQVDMALGLIRAYLPICIAVAVTISLISALKLWKHVRN